MSSDIEARFFVDGEWHQYNLSPTEVTAPGFSVQIDGAGGTTYSDAARTYRTTLATDGGGNTEWATLTVVGDVISMTIAREDQLTQAPPAQMIMPAKHPQTATQPKCPQTATAKYTQHRSNRGTGRTRRRRMTVISTRKA